MEDKILIVSASEKSADTLAHILKHYGWNNIDFASGGMESKRVILRTIYDLIIINSPLKDSQGFDIAVDFVQNTTASVVLIAKSDIVDLIASKVEGEGVIVISKPLQQKSLLGAVRLSLAFRDRMKKLMSINIKYENKYEELRLVSRAKCTLIEKTGMTEQEAHRHIEKQAMDRRESKSIVAANIIKKYMN